MLMFVAFRSEATFCLAGGGELSFVNIGAGMDLIFKFWVGGDQPQISKNRKMMHNFNKITQHFLSKYLYGFMMCTFFQFW